MSRPDTIARSPRSSMVAAPWYRRRVLSQSGAMIALAAAAKRMSS
jgi:hypothetical protein